MEKYVDQSGILDDNVGARELLSYEVGLKEELEDARAIFVELNEMYNNHLHRRYELENILPELYKKFGNRVDKLNFEFFLLFSIAFLIQISMPNLVLISILIYLINIHRYITKRNNYKQEIKGVVEELEYVKREAPKMYDELCRARDNVTELTRSVDRVTELREESWNNEQVIENNYQVDKPHMKKLTYEETRD